MDKEHVNTKYLRAAGALTGWTATKYDAETFARQESFVPISELPEDEVKLLKEYYSKQ